MEATEANMRIKVKQLEMTGTRTNVVLGGKGNEAMERHLSTLKHLSREINRMRLDVEALKLVKEEDATGIQAWNAELHAKLEKADTEVEKVTTWLDERQK